MKRIHWLSVFVILFILSGCSGDLQIQRPTPLPPLMMPTTATSPEPAASATPLASNQPTATALATMPTRSQVLPAPLYFIDAGQVQRLEVDAQTITQITNEVPASRYQAAVTALDVSPVDGSLAYVVEQIDGSVLVQTDLQGQSRHVLFSLPNGAISHPRWSPHGSEIAVRLSPDPDTQINLVSGVYAIAATQTTTQTVSPTLESEANRVILPVVVSGSNYTLLAADDSSDLEVNPAPFAYAPNSWSPDGNRLLLDGQHQFAHVCKALIKDLATDHLFPLAPADADAMTTACNQSVWSQDSSSLYANMQPIGQTVLIPGLWRSDAVTGGSEQIFPGQDQGESLLITAPKQGPDDQIYFFMSRTTQTPDPTYTPPLQYTMYRASGGGTGEFEALRNERDVLRFVLWDEAARGAVVMRIEVTTPVLVWLPVDGSAAVELPVSGYDVNDMRWGKP
ncbi:MAG: lipoprotein [Chloroflexales bacterium]|nr:lipoprotein [Chloroflexales bacterium]